MKINHTSQSSASFGSPGSLEKFRKVVANEPLLETNPSLQGIDPRSADIEAPSLYYGTGLCTATELSVDLPFDILSMLFTAEKLRRELGLGEIYHHIADTHAKSNKQLSPTEVDKVAIRTQALLDRIILNLKLEHFHLMLASDFDKSPLYLEILRSIGGNEHEYVKREMADMEWYRTTQKVRIKLGWIIQASETELGYDERLFDRAYKIHIGRGLSFLYLKPGRTFDTSRPKAAPYVSIAGERRVLLRPGENAIGKLHSEEQRSGKELGGARRHLTDIIRLFEKLYGSIGRDIPFESKIQYIIDKAVS